ncbi:S8 family serine peptidase [Dactylosporangium sucinum]|uniref:Uncharacterized protein n=1 Tax=Dactylosporangium sucinum TaxID=1424081 RepID=A0A917X1P7_9ACTN|nr:S8 family serine peptidase [Dactylosporangium sucinum]GGM51176.1 hypothetical protein GCM10007977_061220 [Dactylosporangium sucinum]
MRRAAILGLATVAATGTALGAGLPAWAAPAEGSIQGVARDAKANSYIVVLKDNASAASADQAKASAAVSASAKSLSAKFGGKVTAEWSTALRGFAINDLSADGAKKIAGDPSVAYVEYNSRAKKADTQTGATWGLDRIDQLNLPLNGSYTYPNSASNVTAYIVDTGIYVDHSNFGGRATLGPNYAEDGHTNSYDCNGHGTHVAGTVGSTTYGVAKGVSLVAVRVLDCDGFGYASESINGINWVTSNAAGKHAVANYSIGFGGINKSVDAAIKNSINSGVTWAVAAGNGDDYGRPLNACNYTPGSVTQALVVGATDSSDRTAYFSNYGGCLDLYGPGVDVTSTWYNGGYAQISGTSMATPHVTGAAALILSAHPNYTPGQVHNAVVQSSAINVVKNAPAGTPNKLLQVRQGDPIQVAGKTSTLYNPRWGTTEVYARSTTNHLIYAYYALGWSGWIDLGGNIQGDPSVFYNPDNGSTEVYVRNSDNTVGYRKYLNGWQNWGGLGQQKVAGNPQVIYNPRFKTTEIYVRTDANKLAFRYFANGKVSDNWVDLGGALTSDPGLVYNPRFGTTEAYVRNTDGGVDYKYYSNEWSKWNPLNGSVAAGANPVVLFNPRFGTTEVYVRAADNSLSFIFYATGWSKWATPIAGTDLAGDPALLYNPNAKTTEVYVRKSNNQIQYLYYINSWNGWTNLQGSFSGNPAVIFNPTYGTTEVYARNQADGHANYKYYANGWSGWNDISA